MSFQWCLCSVISQRTNRVVNRAVMVMIDLPLSNGLLQISHRNTASNLDDIVAEGTLQVEQSVKPRLTER
jgi:hypothetical protein